MKTETERIIYTCWDLGLDSVGTYTVFKIDTDDRLISIERSRVRYESFLERLTMRWLIFAGEVCNRYLRWREFNFRITVYPVEIVKKG